MYLHTNTNANTVRIFWENVTILRRWWFCMNLNDVILSGFGSTRWSQRDNGHWCSWSWVELWPRVHCGMDWPGDCGHIGGAGGPRKTGKSGGLGRAWKLDRAFGEDRASNWQAQLRSWAAGLWDWVKPAEEMEPGKCIEPVEGTEPGSWTELTEKGLGGWTKLVEMKMARKLGETSGEKGARKLGGSRED